MANNVELKLVKKNVKVDEVEFDTRNPDSKLVDVTQTTELYDAISSTFTAPQFSVIVEKWVTRDDIGDTVYNSVEIVPSKYAKRLGVNGVSWEKENGDYGDEEYYVDVSPEKMFRDSFSYSPNVDIKDIVNDLKMALSVYQELDEVIKLAQRKFY